MIEKIFTPDRKSILALWIKQHRESYEEGCTFYTKDHCEIQVGFMRYNAGKIFAPHKHLGYNRTVRKTTEVLLICKGSLRFDLYLNDGTPVQSGVARAGDILVLFGGGHGFEVSEDCEIIEIKQGPYNQRFDKVPLFNNELKEDSDGTV